MRHLWQGCDGEPQVHTKGLVVFSTSAAKTNLSLSTSLTLVEGRTFKQYDKVLINMDYPLFGSNFEDRHGHVRSLILPEGDYYLLPTPGNPAFFTTKAPIYKFTVARNEAAYLGNIDLAASHLTYSTDFQSRDVAFFKEKNPAFATTTFRLTPLEKGPALSDFKIQGTIWEAPQ